MAINEKLIEIEGQRGIFQILVYIHQNGEILSGKLYNNKPDIRISNNTTAKRALEILIKHELVYKKDNTTNRAIYYSLTDKGSKFCECLKQIEKILGEK